MQVESLLSDPSKARRVLGWKPEYDFKGIVKDMIKGDDEELHGIRA